MPRQKPTGRSKPNPKSNPKPRAGSSPVLADLRQGIDQADRQIIRWLNTRSGLVVEVGKLKRAAGIPIYAPHRESEVLKRVLEMNKGPLKGQTIEAVYRELMSGSFALEKPLSIGFLGPPGSYSHLAAVRHFGSSVDFEDLHEIAGVFTEVERGHVDYGLVPIENSIHGGIVETLDSFVRTAGRVRAYAEVQLGVHHAFMANCAPSEVKRIYSKPEVFSQCRAWLSTQYPNAELAPAASSSRAVQLIAEGKESNAAAIGSVLSAGLYGVNILFENIEDDPNNITRFLVISMHEAQQSGEDKTLISFTTMNKPGALVSVLTVFQRAGINLTHIDKRPGGRVNWQYTFFIEAEGHNADERMARAAVAARKHCRDLVVLGSYPKSKRVL